MAEQTTKRATQKALDAFCTSNNITPESIWDKLSSLYPNKYIQSDKLTKELIKGLFKAYDEVDDVIITAYLKELDETGKLESYTAEALKVTGKKDAADVIGKANHGADVAIAADAVQIENTSAELLAKKVAQDHRRSNEESAKIVEAFI